MRELRPIEIHNLPKVRIPNTKNSILTPESTALFFPLSISKRVIQRKTEKQPRGRLSKCILVLFFYFHNNTNMLRIIMVQNNFCIIYMYCLHKI